MNKYFKRISIYTIIGVIVTLLLYYFNIMNVDVLRFTAILGVIGIINFEHHLILKKQWNKGICKANNTPWEFKTIEYYSEGLFDYYFVAGDESLLITEPDFKWREYQGKKEIN